MNNNTKEIEANYLSEKLGDKQARDFLFGELLQEEKAVLITEVITQLDEKQHLIPKTLYYMPYYVVGHSRFKPTIINDNVSGACNTSYDVQVEVVFSYDGLCRYVVFPIKTQNVPVMECINDLFDTADEDDLREVGISWEEYDEDEENDTAWYLDFYNEAGQRFLLPFLRLEDLKAAIVSMRIIDIVCHIDGKE